MTTTTKIAGEAMTDRLKPGHCHKCGLMLSDNPHPEAGKPPHYLQVGCPKECIPCLTLSRHQWAGRAMKAENEVCALLASKAAVPWIAHWSGSNPYKGWSIRQGRDEVIWFGETISSETVEGIVLAHNKCFDCDGTGCVMNCSGLRHTAPAQSRGDAEQADEAVTITPAPWADVYYFARASEIGEFVTRAQEVFDAARAKDRS